MDSTSPSTAPVPDLAGSPDASSQQAEDRVQSSQTQTQIPRLPSLRVSNDVSTDVMRTVSSTPLGAVNAARRPTLPQPSFGSSRGSQLPQDMQAKMKAFHLSRQGAPPAQNLRMPPNVESQSSSATQVPMNPSPGPSGLAPTGMASQNGALAGPAKPMLANNPRPQPPNFPNSAPAIPGVRMNPKMGGLAAKRGLNKGMKLSDATGTPPKGTSAAVPDSKTGSSGNSDKGGPGSLFNKYSEYVDTNTGTLKFKGKATIHGKGIDFSSGTSFNISLDEVDNLEELGKGNYGTVYRVRHSRPQLRRPGQGLAGNKAPSSAVTAANKKEYSSECSSPQSSLTGNTTGVVMAMKEIRLELDEAKFAAIIMELDILHRCTSPFIVDFYGAFFQEGAVYICMEYMDGGSVDKLYGDGVPEGVLREITLATVKGLKSLKEDHNIIHRDVKPTNILVNTRGQVKICDFGVSGNLVASIAKTNIGCQSYMAPERISGGGVAQAGANPGGGTYSVQSDIWSLGLTIIECALGQYPYPPETYDNIFSQLSVSPRILVR